MKESVTRVTVHDLKCWPVFFAPLARGEKTFELRVNDRDYKVGDLLLLREWDYETRSYTGAFVVRRVPYILADAIQMASVGTPSRSNRPIRPGQYVVLSLAQPTTDELAKALAVREKATEAKS